MRLSAFQSCSQVWRKEMNRKERRERKRERERGKREREEQLADPLTSKSNWINISDADCLLSLWQCVRPSPTAHVAILNNNSVQIRKRGVLSISSPSLAHSLTTPHQTHAHTPHTFTHSLTHTLSLSHLHRLATIAFWIQNWWWQQRWATHTSNCEISREKPLLNSVTYPWNGTTYRPKSQCAARRYAKEKDQREQKGGVCAQLLLTFFVYSQLLDHLGW